MVNKNSSLRCVLVLLVIAIVCVFLLAVLNDVLYVAPDMSVFAKAKDGEYTQVEIKDVATQSGKMVLLAEGKTTDGKDVVGLYVEGKKYGKADSFQLAIVVEKETDQIVGAYMITDGSTGGYYYDAAALENAIGTEITSTNYLSFTDLIFTGASSKNNSSFAVMNAFQTAAEYYKGAYNN